MELSALLEGVALRETVPETQDARHRQLHPELAEHEPRLFLGVAPRCCSSAHALVILTAPIIATLIQRPVRVRVQPRMFYFMVLIFSSCSTVCKNSLIVKQAKFTVVL